MRTAAPTHRQSASCLHITRKQNNKLNKMKLFIVAALFVAAAMAAPTTIDGEAQIVSQNSENIGVGPYNYGFQTSNGISQNEEGQLKNVGTENEALEVRGQFSYTGNDGIVYTVTYIANELGFQAQGAHIPQAQ